MTNDETQVCVRSLAWKNVNPAIIKKQKDVFRKLDIPLSQEIINKIDHGHWMDMHIHEAKDDDILIFCDIDAFPLTKKLYEKSISIANKGYVFGMAQHSNLDKNAKNYAGPMYIAFKKNTWAELGEPTMKPTAMTDAAEQLSINAGSLNKLSLLQPNFSLYPKWSLNNETTFGVGTFYGNNEFFHLFQSRKKENIDLLVYVANQVISGSGLNINQILTYIKRKRFVTFINNELTELSESFNRKILLLLKKLRIK